MKPDLVVLRPGEVASIEKDDPEHLTTEYRAARVFDVSDRISRVRYLSGRGHLKYDRAFTVYQGSPIQ